MDIDSTWIQFKENNRFEMLSKAFKDYVEPVTFLGMEENCIRLSVPNKKAAEWIQARMQAEILNHYRGHFPEVDGQLSLELVVEEEKGEVQSEAVQGEGEEEGQIEAGAAWSSLLTSLQGTPIEVPSSWEEETSARWDAGGEWLIVSVPPSTDSAWLEKKFLPVAEIFFAQDHQQKKLLLEQRGGTGYGDLLVKVQRGAYEEIVQPNKIVPIQIYMLHHWLPVLSASPFWVVVAMRQVSFVNKAEDSCVTKPISSRNIARWAPMRHVQVIDWLNKGGFSGWFFKKTKEGYEDHPPEYKIWNQIPVAPHHLAWIEKFFHEHQAEDSAVTLLEAALNRTGEIRRMKPGDVDLPGSYQKKRRTLVDIVSDAFPGQLTQHVYDLITQLENQIVRPNLSITIPHYFFKNYMDELTANEAAFIWYLRSLYRENSDDTLQFKGFQPLESSLGCGRNTPQRLLDKCLIENDEEEERASWDQLYTQEFSLKNWLSAKYLKEPKRGRTCEYKISVRSSEPIHQSDKGSYEQLVEKHLEEEERTKGFQPGNTQNITPNTQKETALQEENTQNVTGNTQNQPDDVQNQTGNGQNITDGMYKSEHLNSLQTKEAFNNLSNEFVKPPLPEQAAGQSVLDPDLVGGGAISKLLGFASYNQYEKQQLKKLLAEKEKIFLAWVIRNYITEAKFPVRLAVRNIEEGNNPEGYYLELASLGWGSIQDILETRIENLDLYGYGDLEGENGETVQVYRNLSDSAKSALKDLKKTRFHALFDQV